ncbi:MAG: hypothetical protein R2751_03305 [Bacteroidales bacterium]
MKKSLFLVPLGLLFLISCEKQENDITFSSSLPDYSYISFENIDGTLSFQTLDDLQLMLKYLSDENRQFQRDFESAIGFQSFRLYCEETDTTLPNTSELLTLLDPTKRIVVEGYILEYNFKDETVIVSSQSNIKSTPQEISWDDDVIGIVFNKGNLKDTKDFTPCSSQSTTTTWSVTNSTITATLKYNNIPLAYALKAEIAMSPNRQGIYLWLGFGNDSSLPSGYECYYETKKTCVADPSGHSDGYYWDRSVHIYGPSTTNRLDGYNAWVQYSSVDEYQVPTVTQTTTLHLVDHLSDISCD